jgi:hypothetical protein
VTTLRTGQLLDFRLHHGPHDQHARLARELLNLGRYTLDRRRQTYRQLALFIAVLLM